jgi:outer membrane protein OmpA-like peptidoglycan-associated protein
MRRDQVVTIWVVASVLALIILPTILYAQEQRRPTDFRERDSYTDKELATELFPPLTRQIRREKSVGGVPLKVFFATNSANIIPEYLPELDKLGRVLTNPQYSEARLLIAGYTDNVGSDRYNLNLSARRAESVKRYLLQKFPQITPERLTAKGYGKANPIADNSTPEGQAKNRRIEAASLEN